MSDITRDYSFGGWLRHLRCEQNITLRDAAKRLNMDPGNLSKLERSELSPPNSAARIDDICRRLGFKEGVEVLLKSCAYQHHLGLLKSDFDRCLKKRRKDG